MGKRLEEEEEEKEKEEVWEKEGSRCRHDKNFMAVVDIDNVINQCLIQVWGRAKK